MSKDLYVKHLSPQTTEEDLRKLFAVAGKVTYVFMVTDKESGTFLNCAYVSMSKESEGKGAIDALDGARYMNASIEVSAALPRRATPGGNKPGKGRTTPRGGAPERTQLKEAGRSAEKRIAKGDWTAPAPKTQKERGSTSPRRPTAAPRSAGPKKGPGPKRGR